MHHRADEGTVPAGNQHARRDGKQGTEERSDVQWIHSPRLARYGGETTRRSRSIGSMRHLDLFSGIGGFALACTWVWGKEYENVGHSEIEPYPCKVYHRHFPESKCLGDITKIRWEAFQGIDLITGGFPCQPHSVAGKRKGSGDARDLWGECVRALAGVRPQYAVFENVPGLITSEHGKTWERVKVDLEACGYEGVPVLLSASDVGAKHRRLRAWIVAKNAEQFRCDSEKRQSESGLRGLGKFGAGDHVGFRRAKNLADANKQRLSRASRRSIRSIREKERESARCEPCRRTPETWGTWSTEPDVGRVAYGIPSRVDRLKGLGNAIVPQVAQVILEAIKNSESR